MDGDPIVLADSQDAFEMAGPECPVYLSDSSDPPEQSEHASRAESFHAISTTRKANGKGKLPQMARHTEVKRPKVSLSPQSKGAVFKGGKHGKRKVGYLDTPPVATTATSAGSSTKDLQCRRVAPHLSEMLQVSLEKAFDLASFHHARLSARQAPLSDDDLVSYAFSSWFSDGHGLAGLADPVVAGAASSSSQATGTIKHPAAAQDASR